LSVRPVPDSGGSPAEQGRRLVVERKPTVVDGVVDYNRDEDGTLYLFGPYGTPAGDFEPGTYQAVYYAPAEQAG
jgi:hypothetical protein